MDESIDGVVQQHIHTHLLPFHCVEYDEHGGDEKDGSENSEAVSQTAGKFAQGRVLENGRMTAQRAAAAEAAVVPIQSVPRL